MATLRRQRALAVEAPMKHGVVKQVRIGPYKFRNVPAFIFDDAYNITSIHT